MSVALHLKGDAFRPWMTVPLISVPLHSLLKRSVIDYTKVTFTEKWKEKQVLPRVLSTLRLSFEEWGLDFTDFEDFCKTHAHPSNIIAFSPIDDPLMRFSGDELITYINPPSPLPTASSPSSLTPHCHLNVHFVGHAARRLAASLNHAPSPHGSHGSSRSSTPSHHSARIVVETVTSSPFAAERTFVSPDVVSSPVVTETEIYEVSPTPMHPRNSPLLTPGPRLPSPSAIRRTTGTLLRSFGATAVRAGSHAAQVVSRLVPPPTPVPPSPRLIGRTSPPPMAPPPLSGTFLRRMGLPATVSSSPQLPVVQPLVSPTSTIPPPLSVLRRHPPASHALGHDTGAFLAPSPTSLPHDRAQRSHPDVCNQHQHVSDRLTNRPSVVPSDRPTYGSTQDYRSDARAPLSAAPGGPSFPSASDTRDPAWDSHDRQGFSFTPGRASILRARQHLGPNRGPTWTWYMSDPQDGEFVIDPATGLIPPWFATRPDYGEVLCHAVQSTLQFQDKALFLSAFVRRFDVASIKHVLPGLPTYSSAEPFLAWYSKCGRYLMSYGIYLPPAHTLRANLPLGIWFSDLPYWLQQDVQNTLAGLLITFLKSKYSGLTSDPKLSLIVQHQEDGYLALYDLHVYTGHPQLQAFPVDRHEPRQHADCSLFSHVSSWQTLLHHKALDGLHYSDRFFLQQFCRSLHASLQSDIASWLEHDASRFPLHSRLPNCFAPERLVLTILQRAQFLRNDALALKTPRECSRPSHPVRSLAVPLPDDDEPLFLAALASVRTCFICGTPDHLAPDCPRFSAIRDDPFARRAILRLFRDDPSPSGPSYPRPIRAVTSGPPGVVIAALESVASDASISPATDAAPAPLSTPLPDFR
jgi:Zinc knuckle